MVPARGIYPSEQYSDSLYHFEKEPDRILEALERSFFTLNYVVEDFSFLGIGGISKVAFPMLCFCDILPDRDRIEPHAKRYGHYGIGLSKTWGRRNGIQPVHYLIEESPFSTDLVEACRAANELDEKSESKQTATLASFLLTTLAYAKPTYGLDGTGQRCFEDECEWRFVPRDLEGMPTAIPDPTSAGLDHYRKTIWRPQTYRLAFSYGDVEALFVPSSSMLDELLDTISGLDIDDRPKDILKTKIRTF